MMVLAASVLRLFRTDGGSIRFRVFQYIQTEGGTLPLPDGGTCGRWQLRQQQSPHLELLIKKVSRVWKYFAYEADR